MKFRDLLYSLGIRTRNKIPYKVLEYDFKKSECLYKIGTYCKNKKNINSSCKLNNCPYFRI